MAQQLTLIKEFQCQWVLERNINKTNTFQIQLYGLECKYFFHKKQKNKIY